MNRVVGRVAFARWSARWTKREGHRVKDFDFGAEARRLSDGRALL
jgi:hypothetical protein